MLIYSKLFCNIMKCSDKSLFLKIESGCDQRFAYPYFSNETEYEKRKELENEILYNTRKYNSYKTLIDYLESSASETEKIEKINMENTTLYKVYDLYSGGLMNDWCDKEE